MLFHKLYNWIKYKTLPASYFFKNRLFIEREGRYKRILTNFGLVFRNNKWANYEVSNIKLKFKLNYFYYLFFFLWAVLIFWFLSHFTQLYSYSLVFNSLYYYLWLSLDTVLYYISFLSWLLLILFSNLVKWFFSKWFMTNINSYADTQVTSVFSRELLNKNALFYTWFTKNAANNFIKVNTLEKLFQTNVNAARWDALANYFTVLYKVVFYMNLLTTTSNSYTLVPTASVPTLFSKKNYLLLYFWQKFIGPFELNKIENCYNAESLFHWNLNNIIFELDNGEVSSHWARNQFYLFNLDLNTLNTLSTNYVEFFNANNLLNNQLRLAKQYRWLYKYSSIHRNLLTTVVNITNTKKLLNSGFYSLNLFYKNLWGSEYLTNAANSQSLISTYHSLLYYNLFCQNTETAFTTNAFFEVSNTIYENLLSLRHYENSFLWFIKRDYFFKALPAYNSYQKLFIQPTRNIAETITPTSDTFNLVQSYLAKGFAITPSALIKSDVIPAIMKNADPVSNSFMGKDLFLLFKDNELFNKTNIDFLYLVTLPSFTGLYNLPYFNYLAYQTASLSTGTFFFDKANLNLQFYNLKWLLNFIPGSCVYLTDLYYFLFL